MHQRISLLSAAILLCAPAVLAAGNVQQDGILGELPTASLVTTSTVPSNGDLNPYGVAFVPPQFPDGGLLSRGDMVVSNFNNANNVQGTGTTIVRVSNSGIQHLFFQGAAGLGLSTALAVLKRGLVLVGNVPTSDGTCATIKQGSLLVINRWGQQVASLVDRELLNGPWDLTVNDQGEEVQVFVSNVLSGTVTRLDLKVPVDGTTAIVQHAVQIASGYAHRCDPAALVVGPTGLALDHHSMALYVASTADNAIYEVGDAGKTLSDNGKGRVVYADSAHLRGPLGLVLAPEGHLLTTNGDAVNGDPNHPSELVEFTRSGQFIAETPVDSSGQGGAFGIALKGQSEDMFKLAAVDDINNTLKVWTVQ